MTKMRMPLAAVLMMTGASVGLPTEGWSAVSELVVTTRKREESLQDVPLSVAAFTAEDLTRQGILSISDLSLSTPGLSIEQQTGGGFATPVIRGMAQNVISGDLSYDNNVGIFVNGVYQSGRNTVDLDLIGIERVEVARGPQSALYGRSTFAGAINYVFADPTDEFQGEVSGTIGSDEDYGVTADIGGPIVANTLKARLSLGYREFDGTFKNLAGGDNLQGYESFSAAGAVVFTPNDQFTATINGLYSDRTSDQDAQFLVDLNCGADLEVPPNATYYCGDISAQGDVGLSPEGRTKSEVEQYSLKLEYELDSVILTSLTSYTEATYDAITDRDYGAASLGTGLTFPVLFAGDVDGHQVFAHAGSTSEDFAQELRIESNNTEGYSWMLGAYYFDSETSTDTQAAVGRVNPGDVIIAFPALLFAVDDPVAEKEPFNIFDANTEAWAIYGSVSWDITDQLTLTGEARYTHEEKDTHVTWNFVAVDEMFDDSYNFISPRVILDYKPNDEMMFYVSAAKGIRSGGINGRVCGACTPAQQADERFFDTEENWTYELGAKTAWLDGDLILNGAVYYTDWKDTQLPSLNADNFGTHVNNVDGGVEVWGLELDAIAQLSEMVTVTAGYAYSDPEFKSGTLDASVTSSCGALGDLCDLVTPYPIGPAIVGGNTLGRVAQHQGTVGIIFNGQMANTGWDWYAQTNVNYQSENYARSINALTYGERTLVNMRAALQNENIEFALWAKNLFDEEYVAAQALQPGFDGGRRIDAYQGNGRRFGITGTFRF